MSSHLDSLRQALSHSPDNVPLLLLIAQACLEQFQFEEAKQFYQRALTREPHNFGGQLGLARTAYMEGNISQAIVRTEALLESNANRAEAWVLLSRLYFIEGKRADARKHYEKAKSIDPKVKDEGLERDLFAGESKPVSPGTPQRAANADGGFSSIGGPKDGVGDDEENEPPSQEPIRPQSIAPGDLPVEFERPEISFADVGGMAQVKKEIHNKIVLPIKNPELFKQYGKKLGGGVLMYGPPGCGKTLLSKATAGEINATFMSIGIHQVLDMWIGNSEKNLNKIFTLARQNRPTILFFDEVDALASDRSSLHGSSRNVINQFLAEMDGSIGSNEGVLILGATNAPWQVDAAFRRPGRFDRVLFVPPPDEEARVSIIELIAKDKPIQKLDARTLAKRTKDFSGADLKAIFDMATEEKLAIAMEQNRVVPITNDDLLKAAKAIQPSTRAWFEHAKNYALYANQTGFYNDVLSFLGLKK
jgi:AAA+ superfamily predicted ATPase